MGSTALLGSHQCANVVLLGFAYQRGAIPIGAATVEVCTAYGCDDNPQGFDYLGPPPAIISFPAKSVARFRRHTSVPVFTSAQSRSPSMPRA